MVFTRGADMNRAVDGDIVAVEVFSKDKWAAPSGKRKKKVPSIDRVCTHTAASGKLTTDNLLFWLFFLFFFLGVVERKDNARLLVEGGKLEEDAVPDQDGIEPTGRVVGKEFLERFKP